ncbi:MAG: PEP-CTERM sorting domain-containing protein [Azoarcus sp.]|nr:PEP-CTERM sorting domain-containing protein [Azoarcus sp.]
MNKQLRRFALPVLLFAFTGAAQAETITNTFENGSYGFFEYKPYEMVIIDGFADQYKNTGLEDLAKATGSGILANWFETSPVSFASASKTLFTLDSFWASGAWGSQTLTIVGLKGGEEVWTTDIAVSTTAKDYNFSAFSSMYIDEFKVFAGGLTSSPQANTWGFGSVTVTTVPEPETYVMLLAGLGLMGVVVRRRQAS